MNEHGSSDPEADDDLRVTELAPSRQPRAPRSRVWRWTPLAISLIALVALVVSVTPASRGMLAALQSFIRPATPTSTSKVVSSITVQILETPTANMSAQRAPALAQAPVTCLGGPPPLSQVGPPGVGAAVGEKPIWVSGLSGTYPTLALGSGDGFDWKAPYTLYGWPAPIVLVLGSGFSDTVTLSGYNLQSGASVAFGFVQAGGWGAPTLVMAPYTLNPVAPPVPVGGEDTSGSFWYGYAFIQQAGCYALTASWPGGKWQVIVSAGRLPRD